jgi:hypothetical protein
MGSSNSRECGCCNIQEGSDGAATQMEMKKPSVTMSPQYTGPRNGSFSQHVGNGAHVNPPTSEDAEKPDPEAAKKDKFGVGLVFKSSRDGKMVCVWCNIKKQNHAC